MMKRKIGTAVAAGLISLFAMAAAQGALANTINVHDDANPVIIDSTVSSGAANDVVIMGFVKPFNIINNLSSTDADEIQLPNSNPATELATLNNLIQPDIIGAVQICGSGGLPACGLSIIIKTLYFSMKFGRDTAFFKNVSGQPITLTFTTGQASGLSHVTVYGGDFTPTIPAPAALPLLLTGIAGLGWLSRRRTKKA